MGAVVEQLKGLEKYTIAEPIGRGQYGKVSLAVDKRTGEQVAIKKIRVGGGRREQTLKVREASGVVDVPAIVAIEIKILRLLNHNNVIGLRDVIYMRDEIHLVFDYMEHDMCGLIQKFKFTQAQVKCYLKQLLEGLHYCHVNKVIHRDIKSANLLVNKQGVLKIADFGMAAPLPDNPKGMHCGVVTLWNRAPELLLGFDNYGSAVDLWSVGCVLAEMLVRMSILPGKNEEEQLYWIFNLCGTPDETTWPGVSKSPVYVKFMEKHGKRESRIQRSFSNVEPAALDLLQRLLTLNPAKRITAAEALLSDYMWSLPLPCSLSELPVPERPCNELIAKMSKRPREGNNTERQRSEVKRLREDKQPKEKNKQPAQPTRDTTQQTYARRDKVHRTHPPPAKSSEFSRREREPSRQQPNAGSWKEPWGTTALAC